MDRVERLNLLFEGDENLLKSRPGINAGKEEYSSSNFVPEGSQINQGSVLMEESRHSVTQSDSEEGFDDYLKYFADVHKRNARRQAMENQSNTRPKSRRAHNRDSKGPDETIQDTTAAILGPTIEAGGPPPLFFCPAVAISRFPYKYVQRELSDRVAKQFFDGGKFWNMSWELYYVHPPPDISDHPIVLIPATQAHQLIASINKTLRCSISIPTDSEEGLLLPFSEDGTPQPKFLGVSSSREMKEELERGILPPQDGELLPPNGCSPSLDRSFAAFKRKMDTAVDATRRKNKASKAKKRQAQIKKQQDWCRSLKRLQCYLGLLPRYPRGQDLASQEQDERNFGIDCGNVPLALDVEKEAAFPFDKQPVFLSVDVESNERCHNQITEIGISTLDTRELLELAPGEAGKNWAAKIRSRHFRISEYGHVVNKDFVSGCPDKFEFGVSEWVSIAEAAKLVDSCFQPPYSAHAYRPDPKSTHKERDAPEVVSYDSEEDGGVILDPVEPLSNDAERCSRGSDAESRNLILLGHDTQADIAYLRNLGCATFNTDVVHPEADPEKPDLETELPTSPLFLEALDTATLYRALKREPHTRSLGHILLDSGLTGWNLHNAGNDACYTMRCMICLALNSYLQLHGSTDQTQKAKGQQPLLDYIIDKEFDGNVDISLTKPHDPIWEAEVARRVAESVEETKDRVISECEGWTIAMGQGSDRCVDDIDGGEAQGIEFTLSPEKGKQPVGGA